MPTLYEMLCDYEQDQLEMIAEQWGIDFEIDWRNDPVGQLTSYFSEKTQFEEFVVSLPDTAAKALNNLINEGGRIPRAQFARSYGDIREVGAGIRGKERPDRYPTSDAERLFYRGLIGLAFFDGGGDTKEYFYLPEEFLTFLHTTSSSADKREISTVPKNELIKPTRSLENQISGLIGFHLAIHRGEIPEIEYSRLLHQNTIPFIDEFLAAVDVFEKKTSSLDTEKVKKLLITSPSELVPELFNEWRESEDVNELKLLDGLTFEGQWKNDPVKPRKKIIDILDDLPEKKWINLDEFIQWMYANHPDFLRSGGEYEQWFIKKTKSGTYLDGFDSWPQVDGALIKYFLTGPLYWFGLLELAKYRSDNQLMAFRKTDHASGLLLSKNTTLNLAKLRELTILKNGEILIPHNAQREMLYQIARFCEWTGKNEKYYKFRINPLAIRRAQTQGINPAQIKMILKKYGRPPIPDNIFKAIDRWGKGGSKIMIQNHMIVRFAKASTVEKINTLPMKKYIVELLNPTTIIINEQDITRFENALIEQGLFVDIVPKYNRYTKYKL